MKKIFIFIISLTIFTWCNIVFSRETLESIEIHLLKENYTQAIEAAKRAVPTLSAGDIPRAHYLLGLSYLKTNQTEAARSYFKLALGKAKDNGLIEEIKLAEADSYYVDKDFEQASLIYARFLTEHRNSEYKEIAKFKLAQAYLKLGEWQEAKKLIREVARSSSIETEAAKRILEEGQFYFSIQVGSFQDEGNARKLLRKLKRDKFDAYIIKTHHENLIFYRVRVGKLETKSAADKILKELKDIGLPVKLYP